MTIKYLEQLTNVEHSEKETENLHRLLSHEYFTDDSDSDDSYCITHTKSNLIVEFPSAFVKGSTAHVNMMAVLGEVQTPEEVTEHVQLLIRQRDYLRERGYRPFELFAVYDDGVEYIYDIPTESQADLMRILCDLGECGNLSK